MSAETPEFERLSQGIIRREEPQRATLVAKKSNLESRYDALCDAINQLASNVEAMANQLGPVLGPSYPTPSGATEEDTPEQSAVAHNIHHLTRTTEMINDTVDDVRRRLEV